MSKFDISALGATETFDVPIMNPATGEPLLGDDNKECSVTVHGPGTRAFAAAQSAANNRQMKRIRAKGRTDTTPEEDQAAKASFLTAITVSFNNFDYKDGEGAEMFRACYLDSTMGWLTDQVNVGAGDWGNFTKAA